MLLAQESKKDKYLDMEGCQNDGYFGNPTYWPYYNNSGRDIYFYKAPVSQGFSADAKPEVPVHKGDISSFLGGTIPH